MRRDVIRLHKRSARDPSLCANARDLKNDMATEIDEICDEMPQDIAGDLH
jgi:hypothetical protein